MSAPFAHTDDLMRLTFDGCTIKQMLDACEQFLGTPVRLSPVGAPEKSVKSAGYPQADFQELLDSIYPKDKPLGSDRYLEFISERYRREHWDRPFIVDSYTHRLKLCYVHIGKTFFGHISVLELETPLEEIDDERVRLASRFVGLACVAAGLSHQMLSPDELLGALLGRKITTRTRLMVESAAPAPEEQARYRLLTAVMRGGVLEYVYPLLRRSLGALYPGCWVTPAEDCACALLRAERSPAREAVLLEGRLSDLLTKGQCAACVSPVFGDLLDCPREQERMLALPALRRAQAGGVVFFEDHAECGLFYESGLPPEALRSYCHPQLLKMRADDAREGTQFFETLRAHAQAGFKASRTAGRLFVHVNTVLYRLSRIEALYALDLEDEQTRFRLALSLRILDYIE